MRECAARALTVHADAVETMKDYTTHVFGPVDTFVSAMLEHLERRNSRVIDSAIVAAALGDVSGTKLDAAMPSVECIDAWMTPQLTYNPAAKTFDRAQVNKAMPAQGTRHTQPSIHGSAISRAEMFRMRHELSWQRLVRNPLFIQSHHSSASTPGGQSKLSRLDSLQGTQVGARCCVLGSLVQIEEGSLSLEDPYAVVKLDTTHAKNFGGFFAEGMIIIAEGRMDLSRGVFIVDV